MKIDKDIIKIDGVEYARKDSISHMLSSGDEEGLEYVIVRCKDAGVHSGFLKGINDEHVVLVHTRRLWQWWGKTLSGLAIEGTFAPGKCRFSDEASEVRLRKGDHCEILICTDLAKKSLRFDVKGWVND